MEKDFIEAIKRYSEACANQVVCQFNAMYIGGKWVEGKEKMDKKFKEAEAHLDSFAGKPEKESKNCTESKVYIQEDGNGSITGSTLTG